MCGRYTNELEFSQLKLAFDAADETFRIWSPTYNISPSSAPGHEQLLVRRGENGRRVLRLGRFWFIPAWWSKPLSQLPTLFNARAEELDRKKTWRPAVRSHRALIPATGWREFLSTAEAKQPYHFSLGGELLAFGGLYSCWTSPEGEQVESFAILTTAPSQQARHYHDRMPLIMPTSTYDEWLDPARDAAPILRRAMDESLARQLVIFPTHPRGNNTRYEARDVIEPVDVVSPPSRFAAGVEPAPRGGQKSPPAQLTLPLEPPRGNRRN